MNDKELIQEARSRADLCSQDAREAMRDTGEIVTRLADALEAATRERDAALAAIEQVRAIHVRDTPSIGGDWCLDDHHKWPCTTVAALDGAPEPEGRWEYRGRLRSCGYVAEGFISAEHAMNGLKVELEDHPYLVMDDTAIVERARVREWHPVGGESDE